MYILISLIINADGAPVFKSSKTSVWPLMSFVAELPAKSRSLNCLNIMNGKLPVSLYIQVQCGQYGFGRNMVWTY